MKWMKLQMYFHTSTYNEQSRSWYHSMSSILELYQIQYFFSKWQHPDHILWKFSDIQWKCNTQAQKVKAQKRTFNFPVMYDHLHPSHIFNIGLPIPLPTFLIIRFCDTNCYRRYIYICSLHPLERMQSCKCLHRDLSFHVTNCIKSSSDMS